MKKILIFLLILFININVVSAASFDLSSDKVLIYNFETNEILYEKNSTKESQIASLTKLFTVYYSIINIKDINAKVVLTSDVFYQLAERDASTAGFKVGEEVTYLDLLYGAMLPSGADATRALAINLFGSEEQFAKKMTEYMKELGLKHTSFKNSSGLTESGHYSTVEDIYTIMLIALQNDTFRQVYETKFYTTTNGLELKSTYLFVKAKYSEINLDPYLQGIKSGFTSLAGVCLASTAKINNATYLVITTNAQSVGSANQKNYYDAMSIYNYYLENYKYDAILNKNDIIKKITVINSKEKFYDITLSSDFNYLKNLNNNYDFVYDGLEEINPRKINKGDSLGSIKIYENNEEIYREDIILDRAIKFSLLVYLFNHLEIIILIIVIVVFALYLCELKKRNKKKRKRQKN